MATFDSRVQWPGWETVRLIGRGSYGAVYEIQRTVFGHTERAALKFVSVPHDDSDIDDLLSDGYDSVSITQRYESYLKSIVDEYAHMADMKGHPNIVYCDDVHYTRHSDGIGWDVLIKMELLTPLKDVLNNNVTERTVRKLGLDIANALAFCERKNLLHRDIKPQNIFVTEDGTFKLGDFGVAKTSERTVSGTKAGTFKYMAPEVYNNQPYGSKADVYSFGLTMYYILNERRLPFLPLPPETPTTGQEDEAQLRRMKGEPLPRPKHGSDALCQIILKACEFDPKRRCTASELVEMLNEMKTAPDDPEALGMEGNMEEWETFDIFHNRKESALTERPAPVIEGPVRQETPPPPPPSPPRPSSKKGIIIVGVAAAIVLAGALLFFFRKEKPVTPGPETALPQVTEPVTATTKPVSSTSEETTPQPALALQWTGWDTELPAGVTGDAYAIECRQVYRETKLVTVENDDKAPGDGYEHYMDEFGKWSEWSEWVESDEVPEENDLTEVETITEEIWTPTYQHVYDKREVPRGVSAWPVEEVQGRVTRYEWQSGQILTGTTTRYRVRTREATRFYYDKAGWSQYGDQMLPQADGKLIQMKQQYRYAETGGAALREASMENFAISDADYRKHYSDVKETAWYSPEKSNILQTVDELGILLPDSYMRFHPDDQITIGQLIRAAVIINRVYNGYTGLICQNNGRYEAYSDYAVEHGMIVKGEFPDLTREATRQEMAYLLCQALPKECLEEINAITAISDMDMSRKYYDFALTMARAGVISVGTGNMFKPENNATRAQAAAMIEKLVHPDSRTKTQ